MKASESRLALFLMLGQTAERTLAKRDDLVPAETLRISDGYDLAEVMPTVVHAAIHGASAFKLFFVFESYLRDLIIDVLSNDPTVQWWDKLPGDVKKEVEDLAEREDTKSWMALGTRDRSTLMTYPQLLSVIDSHWRNGFSDLLRDKSLIHEARVLSHLRNAVAHMTTIPEEELERIRQVMRDWFRMVAP